MQPTQPENTPGQPTPPPPPPPGGVPGPGSPQQPSNGLGLSAMIVGIASIPALCLCGLGILTGIVAVVLGFLGRQKAERGEATNGGMALAGIITGGVAVVLGTLWLVVGLVGGFDFGVQPDF